MTGLKAWGSVGHIDLNRGQKAFVPALFVKTRCNSIFVVGNHED